MEFRILEAKENDLSGPVIVGEHNLLAASPVVLAGCEKIYTRAPNAHGLES